MQSGNQIPELDDWERPAGRWVTEATQGPLT